MVGCFTLPYVFPKAEFDDGVIYSETYMMILELLGMLLVLSKYFMLVMLIYCSLISAVNNLIYVVILRGLLLVVFVISMLMGSLSNLLVPFMLIYVSYVGRVLFLLIMLVLLLL